MEKVSSLFSEPPSASNAVNEEIIVIPTLMQEYEFYFIPPISEKKDIRKQLFLTYLA